MSRLFALLNENTAALGIANGLLATVARAMDVVTNGRCRLFKYYFVAQPVPPAASPVIRRSSNTRIYRATAGDGIIEQFPRPSSNIAKRFAAGAVCFVAERVHEHANNGELIGFIWIKRDSYREDEVRCDYILFPPDHLAWDFDVYITPSFRMSRAFVKLWDAANEYLRAHSIRWTISRISAFNIASVASHKRMGTIHLDTGLFLVLGPVQFSAISRAPFVHIALRSTPGPSLTFCAPTDAADRIEAG